MATSWPSSGIKHSSCQLKRNLEIRCLRWLWDTHVRLLWHCCSNTSCRTSWHARTSRQRSWSWILDLRLLLRRRNGRCRRSTEGPDPDCSGSTPTFAPSVTGLSSRCGLDLGLSGSSTSPGPFASSGACPSARPDPAGSDSWGRGTRTSGKTLPSRSLPGRTSFCWSIWTSSRGHCRSSPCRRRARWFEAVSWRAFLLLLRLLRVGRRLPDQRRSCCSWTRWLHRTIERMRLFFSDRRFLFFFWFSGLTIQKNDRRWVEPKPEPACPSSSGTSTTTLLQP